MPEKKIKELEEQLAAARDSIVHLTKANSELTEGLRSAEVAFKRARRNARQDGNTLRDEIAVLQRRRG
jgi:predicted  nucleic acid-binding Zn-ribbon protein